MRFSRSIFMKLIEPVSRREFGDRVSRYRGDAYDKGFGSWDHLVALVYAQLSGASSLRSVVEGFNSQSQHHYHLGCGRIQRSTLSDANQRRPVAVFAETFSELAFQLDRKTRRDGADMVRLLDSTPIPVVKSCGWALSNGRFRGMKVHVVYDPGADCPRILDVTNANVNDAQVGRSIEIEPGAVYVFDKGYCHYGWWTQIHKSGCIFVTRPKTNMGLEIVHVRPLSDNEGDGFTVVEDVDVHFASKGDSKLPFPLRRVTVKRHQNGDTITLLTNDLSRSAVQIGALYKGRWQIELLFRWIKQHLKIRRFLGRSANAIKLQIYAAMIAFTLLRIAKSVHRISIPILRFTDLVVQCLFERRDIAAIRKPPKVNPNRKQPRFSPNQLELDYV